MKYVNIHFPNEFTSKRKFFHCSILFTQFNNHDIKGVLHLLPPKAPN